MDATEQARLKRAAAERAVQLVMPGTTIGLGAGTSALEAVRCLAERRVPDVRAVPCSPETEAECKRLGIAVAALAAGTPLTLTIDGADEVDPRLDLVKGHGGALLRE